MPDAIFHHGQYGTFDYTATANVAAGQMVLIGSVTPGSNTGAGAVLGIAHRDFANGTQDALAIGGGVYDCVIAAAHPAGSMLFKEPGNAILTVTATNNARFGPLLEASVGVNSVRQVLHNPIP